MGGFDTSDPTYADVQLHNPGSLLYVPGGTDGTDGDWLRKQVDSVHAGGISQKGTTWYEISGTLEEARRALANAISKAHEAGWQGDTAEAAIRNLNQLHATAESLSATSSKLSKALHGVGQAFSSAQAKSIDDDNAGAVYQQLIDDVNHNGLDALPTDTQVCIPQNSGESTYSGRPGPGGPGPGLPSGMPGPGGPGPRIPHVKGPNEPKNPNIKDPTEPRPPHGPGPGGIGDWPVGPGPGAAGPGGIGSHLPGLDTSSSLAGYHPPGGLGGGLGGGPGGGVGAGGFGGGAGGLGAGGLGAGGLGSGAGPDGLGGGGLAGAGAMRGGVGPTMGTAAEAAAARNAGGARGMIAPMHGAGQGGDDDERERTTWLTEDDDVWGSSDAPPPVIS